MLVYDDSSPGTPLKENQLIPSEYIEGYVKRFFMIQLEGLAYGIHKPEEVRNYLKGVEYFISCSASVHVQIATSNVFSGFLRLSDNKMIEIAKKTFDVNS